MPIEKYVVEDMGMAELLILEFEYKWLNADVIR